MAQSREGSNALFPSITHWVNLQLDCVCQVLMALQVLMLPFQVWLCQPIISNNRHSLFSLSGSNDKVAAI
jgi:hypothetical protein